MATVTGPSKKSQQTVTFRRQTQGSLQASTQRTCATFECNCGSPRLLSNRLPAELSSMELKCQPLGFFIQVGPYITMTSLYQTVAVPMSV